MLSKSAMTVLGFLAGAMEKTKTFDESGNIHYTNHTFYLGDVVKGLVEPEATQAIEELKVQGFIYLNGQSVRITPQGFEYYNNQKDEHKPMGFVPQQ